MEAGKKTLSRREFLQGAALAATAMVASACAAPTPEVKEVEVTRLVEVAGTPQVQQVVVTATPPPVVKEEAPAVLGAFPRSETLIARQLTGRVGTPDNMNLWVGWKWQDRGLQNLADEPLWSPD